MNVENEENQLQIKDMWIPKASSQIVVPPTSIHAPFMYIKWRHAKIGGF